MSAPAPQRKRHPLAREVFGLYLPIVCLVLDPVVFRGNFLDGRPMLEPFKLAAYVFIVGECAVFGLAFANRIRTPMILALAAGFLGGGFLGSLAVGVFLAPFALIGTFAGIGILGFTPLVTAIVYFKTAKDQFRAAKAAAPQVNVRSLRLALVVGLGLAAAIPIGIEAWVVTKTEQMIELLESPDSHVVDSAVQSLNRTGWLLSAKMVADALEPLDENSVMRKNLERGVRAMAPRFSLVRGD